MVGSGTLQSSMTIVKIIETCRDIELACAELYSYFAEIFCEDEDLSGLWQKTAREEENHARQFGMLINLRRENLVESIARDGDMAHETLRRIREMYANVKKIKPPADEALNLAMKLEEDLDEFHTAAMLSFKDESFRNLFKAMMKADKKHLEALQEMSQRF